MKRAVRLTEDALRDPDDIHGFVAESDGLECTNRLVDGIVSALGKLAGPPLRGEHPKELRALGIRQFR